MNFHRIFKVKPKLQNQGVLFRFKENISKITQLKSEIRANSLNAE